MGRYTIFARPPPPPINFAHAISTINQPPHNGFLTTQFRHKMKVALIVLSFDNKT